MRGPERDALARPRGSGPSRRRLPPRRAPPNRRARWTIQRSTLVVGIAAVALAVGAFVLAAGTTSGGLVVVDGASALPVLGSSRPSQPGGSGTAVAEGVLVVEIVGAVDRPGVFELPAGSPDR